VEAPAPPDRRLCIADFSPQDPSTAATPAWSAKRYVFPAVHTPYDYEKRFSIDD
jgi:hypothetical protein